MNTLRNAMQAALTAKSKAAPVVGTSPAQLWISLTSAQKDLAVNLFKEKVSQGSLVVGFDSYYDTLPDDDNRVESFYFGSSDPSYSLAQIRVLEKPISISRQVSYDDCVFQDRKYVCTAFITHQITQSDPVFGGTSVYRHEAWLTQEGINTLMQCMLDSMQA